MPSAHDLTALVREAAAEQSDTLALVESEGRSLTWSQLEEDVRRIATGLGSPSTSLAECLGSVLGEEPRPRTVI